MRSTLLERLRRAGGHVSGSALARELGITRAAVHKHIQKLRREGFEISGTNRLGYLWTGAEDAVDVESLGKIWGSPVIHKAVTGSTQDDAKALAAAALEGTLVVADRQSAGRGRMGRNWSSPSGGLWYSMIFKPKLRPDAVPALTLVAALDWARVVQQVIGRPAGVKWPNDVWVEGRKVVGVLAEMSAEVDRLHWVVLGVGINVNNAPPTETRVPAGSLSAWHGHPLRRDRLLIRWLERFKDSYRRFSEKGFEPFRSDYRRRSLLEGKKVSFESPAGPGRGVVQGVDAQGRLLLRVGKSIHVVAGGEISLLSTVS